MLTDPPSSGPPLQNKYTKVGTIDFPSLPVEEAVPIVGTQKRGPLKEGQAKSTDERKMLQQVGGGAHGSLTAVGGILGTYEYMMIAAANVCCIERSKHRYFRSAQALSKSQCEQLWALMTEAASRGSRKAEHGRCAAGLDGALYLLPIPCLPGHSDFFHYQHLLSPPHLQLCGGDVPDQFRR